MKVFRTGPFIFKIKTVAKCSKIRRLKNNELEKSLGKFVFFFSVELKISGLNYSRIKFHGFSALISYCQIRDVFFYFKPEEG